MNSEHNVMQTDRHVKDLLKEKGSSLADFSRRKNRNTEPSVLWRSVGGTGQTNSHMVDWRGKYWKSYEMKLVVLMMKLPT